MNTIWSGLIQIPEMLYQTRMLRFSDRFREAYMNAFGIDQAKRILELGCGPGALSQALHRWYPNAEIIGTDRDTAFLSFAKVHAPDIRFAEEDATALSVADESVDVTISNTVAEHIEQSAFFGEQHRVLKKGGVCLVLSARRGIHVDAPCVSEKSDFEKEFWSRSEAYLSELDKELGICLYGMNEAEYPLTMQKYGFRDVSVSYLAIDLTPDDPKYSREDAHAMIEAGRQVALNPVGILENKKADFIPDAEIAEMKRLINEKYNRRLELYDAGTKQWDTNVSVIMIVRGIKA